MNKYKVTGLYTISFEMEVEAKNREEAEEMGLSIDIETEWNGNSVFARDEAELNADGTPFDIRVELIDGEEEEDEEDITFTAYLRGEYNGVGFMEDESTYDSKEEAIAFAKARNWDGVYDGSTGEIIWER